MDGSTYVSTYVQTDRQMDTPDFSKSIRSSPGNDLKIAT